MRIVFTGGSSFTGYWFIKELAAAGHEVIATFQHQLDEYPDAAPTPRQRADRHLPTHLWRRPSVMSLSLL